MDQKYEWIPILGVGGNRSARRKPTEADTIVLNSHNNMFSNNEKLTK